MEIFHKTVVERWLNFTAKALGEIKKLGATQYLVHRYYRTCQSTDYRRYNIRPDHPAIVKGKAGISIRH